MESKIEITLKLHLSYINKWITYTALFVLFVWLFLLYSNFSVGLLIGFLLVLGAFILYQYILHKHPAVVTADPEKLEEKETDIPLIRLYRSLMKQTGRME